MQETIYNIGNMDCAHCAQEVEGAVRKISGVDAVRVDFITGKMHLVGDVPYEELQRRIEAVGKTVEVPESDEIDLGQVKRGGILGYWDYMVSRRETQFTLAGGAILLVTLVLNLLGILPETLADVLYTIGMLIALFPVAKNGLMTLVVNRQVNINLLMTIAAFGAVIIGEFLEGATVIFLFSVGEALEGYTADRARQSIRGLMSLKPATATRIRAEAETVVPVEQLAVGDRILIKPGEAIAMDGRVLEGASAVNQAAITGESMSVAKATDDTVFAGTLNGDGMLIVEVTRLAKDNTLSRIIQMVAEAQGVRAPSQRMIDQFATWYTPAVVALAAAVAFVPPLLFGQPFYDTPDGHGWLYRALAMLVIACPCALVISTPVTVISAITAAARRGVLIKGGK
ncbi:MAG: cation-translocating P-type ATPase, partial [Anaerolineae bacterium]|nr:cation-translocating P-type ATPase [Anaerolineae bacterium]